METRTLGFVIRRARKRLQISQDELGRLCRRSRQRVTAWETDDATPSVTEWKDIARHLKLAYKLREKLRLPRRRKGAALWRRLAAKRTDYIPKGDRKTAIRLLAFRKESREQFYMLWSAIRARSDWRVIRLFLLLVPADGFRETEAWMRHLAADCTADWVSPQRVGFRRLPIVDPETRQVVGDCELPALVRDNPRHPGIIFPQPSFLCGSETPRPDGLVGLKVNGTMRWCCTEFERHKVSSYQQQQREMLFDMPVIYFYPDDVRRGDFPERFWKDVHMTLWPAGETRKAA